MAALPLKAPGEKSCSPTAFSFRDWHSLLVAALFQSLPLSSQGLLPVCVKSPSGSFVIGFRPTDKPGCSPLRVLNLITPFPRIRSHPQTWGLEVYAPLEEHHPTHCKGNGKGLD